MPKVDPSSGQPQSDAPEEESELRGGKEEGDSDMPEGANPSGSDAPMQKGRTD